MRKLTQFMRSVVYRLDRWNFSCILPWLFPMSYVFSSFVNLGFFYIGLAFEDNPIRSMGYILFCVAFAIVSVIAFFYTQVSSPLQKHKWLMLGCSLGFFLVCLVSGVLRHGFGSAVFNYLKVFIVLVVPAFVASCICGLKRMECSFFRSLEQAGFFTLPVVLLYVYWAVFNRNPFYRGLYLGFMNYMSFAYTILPVLLAHIQQYSVEAPIQIPFTRFSVPKPQIFRGIVIVLYWLAIIASGTRGAYVCVAVYCVFIFANKLIRKQAVIRFFVLATVLALILLFLLFVYTPPGFSGVGRMSAFAENLLRGEFSTSDSQDDDVNAQIDDLLSGDNVVANPNPVPSVKPSRPSAKPRPEQSDMENSPTEVEEETQQQETQVPVISDRNTYYKLAIGEFVKSPIFGIGPGGYSQKYAAYPHNIILEVLCETGLAGALFLAVLMLFAVIRIFAHAVKDERVCHIMLFLTIYFIQANISGSVWQNAAILCFLGYGFSLPSAFKKNNSSSR